MATQLQIRRGTNSQVAAFTGAEGEIVVNTTNDSVHVNDGSTAGGFEMARADLNNVSDTSLNAALTGNTVSALTITTLTLGATAITATGTELNYVDGVTSAIQTQIDTKAPLASPTFTGTVTADALTVDTNTLVVDATNNRVGIGTSSPIVAGSDFTGLAIDGTASSITLTNGSDQTAYIYNSASEGHLSFEMVGDMRFRPGSAERARITSAGDLLVGTTTGSGTTGTYNGFGAYAGGNIFSSSTGRSIFARRSTDGSIIDFRKDGTTVGSVSTIGGDFVIGSTSGSGAAFRMDGTNNQIYPSNATGSARDAAISLGASTVRFKDLHLSGAVNLANDIRTSGDNFVYSYNGATTSQVKAGFKLEGSTNTLKFFTNSVERMSIASAGQVQVKSREGFKFGNAALEGNMGSSGGSYPVIGYNVLFTGSSANYGTRVGDTSWRIDMGDNSRLQVHSRSSSAAVASGASYTAGPYVALNGTSWTGGSDERLKENVSTITGTDAIDKVKAMRPVNYTWIHDGEGAPNQLGFIAQEMASVVPEVVDIPETETDAITGQTLMWGITYDRLIPLLTSALQEALTKIETLDARVQQLENN
jgi:hypothetical protein